MKIPIELVRELASVGLQLFARKAKARKAIETVLKLTDARADFEDARAAIDSAAAAGVAVTLTIAETAALDVVMDEFAKLSRKAKKAIG